MKALPAKKDLYLREGDEIGSERRSYSLEIEPRNGHYTQASLTLYRYVHITDAQGQVRTEVAYLHTKFQADESAPPIGLWGFYGGGVNEQVGDWAATIEALKFWKTEWLAVDRYYGKMGLAAVLAQLHERGYRPVPLGDQGQQLFPGRFQTEQVSIGTRSRDIYREHQAWVRNAKAHEEALQKAEAERIAAEEEERRRAITVEEAEEEARLNSDDALQVPAEV